MAEIDRPLLNPVLSLRIEPKRDSASGRGKDAKQIVTSRLPGQRNALSGQVAAISGSGAANRTYGGKIQLLARMFPDSYAPSYTPDALFPAWLGLQLIAPYRDGYLIEATASRLEQLAAFIQTADSISAQVDISRVEKVQLYGTQEALRGRTIEGLWESAPELERGKGFIVSFAPFRDAAAREAMLQSIAALANASVFLPTYPAIRLVEGDATHSPEAHAVISGEQTSLAIAMRRYRANGRARATLQVPNTGALTQLLASGNVFRIDPVPRIEVTSPGQGEHPGPLPPHVGNEPIVGVVDGGRTAQTYDQAEAWREPPLIPNGVADTKHGNQVTALVVHGHAWNTNLPLPPLYCRVGTVQAVPKEGSRHVTDIQKLIAYLSDVMARHPETRVWNFSCNQADSCDPNEVSVLGHEIARLARRAGVLPVISAGNRALPNGNVIAPPADCEAALVVAGRKFDGAGNPAEPCDRSRMGPGPEGMLKPDLSWYSQLRVLGGDVLTATSFCTPLVSSLAAHTFHNLKNATPDFVRALILNRTDLDRFDHQRGWGSPDSIRPWTCEAGAVTLAWSGEMRPGQAYYWERIPIPSRLIRGGKLCGRGSLTAIIEPMIADDLGGNYFSSRIEVALQYRKPNGKVDNLLGSMKTDPMTEAEARAELHKWNPVRRHSRDFLSKGVAFSGDALRLYARVYARDLYQFGMKRNEDVPPLKATFVLSISDGTETSDLYNEMRASLGNFVESAVIEQDIEVDHSDDDF
ncbi:MAG: S8 family peptidase [Afipia sp.]